MSKKIIVSKGDITESTADAIVNAANNHLWMGSGVAGAIKRKGGQAIEDEAVSKGPIQVGEAITTAAGDLQCEYVIHAAAMGQDLITSEEKIRSATRNALLRAEELGLRSVDFPALGTGVGGFPVDRAATVMIEETGKFLAGSGSVAAVGFVLFDSETYEAYKGRLGGKVFDIEK